MYLNESLPRTIMSCPLESSDSMHVSEWEEADNKRWRGGGGGGGGVRLQEVVKKGISNQTSFQERGNEDGRTASKRHKVNSREKEQ